MSLAVQLLAHIRRVFEDRSVDRLPTIDVIRGLVNLEEGPWARWWSGDLDRAEGGHVPPRKAGADLAAKLKVFRTPERQPIKPRPIRMPDGRTPRGYLLADFEDAFRRHLNTPNATHATDETSLASGVATVASPLPGEGEEA